MPRSWRAFCCMVEGCEFLQPWTPELAIPYCPVHKTMMVMLILEPRVVRDGILKAI